MGAGADIVVGVTRTELCPVAAILEFIEVRGSQPGAFFLNTESKPVVKSWFVNQIREVLGTLGVPQHDYAGHSFRIGAATTAAMAGVEDSTIQTLGRWHSSVFLQYVRTPKERLASLSATLAKSSSGPGQR